MFFTNLSTEICSILRFPSSSSTASCSLGASLDATRRPTSSTKALRRWKACRALSVLRHLALNLFSSASIGGWPRTPNFHSFQTSGMLENFPNSYGAGEESSRRSSSERGCGAVVIAAAVVGDEVGDVVDDPE